MSDTPAGLRQLLRFYLPLAFTSQMMTLSNPLLNFHLSRAAEPTVPLAAYSVAFGVCILLYAPLLSFPNIGAGLVDNAPTLRRLAKLAVALGLLVSALNLLIGASPLGDWIYAGLLDATPRVAREARAATIALAPIPILVGWRGLRTALLLRGHATRLLWHATALRIGVIVLCLWVAHLLALRRAWTAGLALSLGIGVETLWLHHRTREHRLRLSDAAARNWPAIARFAMPIAISAAAWSALRPWINGVLGRSADSEAAQASFGVLHPLLLVTGSALWALQATGQIHATSRANARAFLRFSFVAIAFACVLVFALGWLPPLRHWLLSRVFPLPPELANYIRPGLRLLFIAPLFLGLRTCFKGMILASGRTGIIVVGSSVYLSLAAASGAAALHWLPNANGALIGVGIVILVEASEAAILGMTASRRLLWRRESTTEPNSAELPQYEAR